MKGIVLCIVSNCSRFVAYFAKRYARRFKVTLHNLHNELARNESVCCLSFVFFASEIQIGLKYV